MGIKDNFVQDNHSRSFKNVLRGIHFQIQNPQAQLVTVMHGKIFDVVVDLRLDSRTFGKWFGVELGENKPCQIYTPPGFAHGFCVLSDFVDLHYKVSREYCENDEGGLNWNDPELAIKWPLKTPLVSCRDENYPFLKSLSIKDLPQKLSLNK